MLDVLSAVGVVAFGLTGLLVGVRLLLLGMRTHELPELAIGTGFVVGVLFGFIPETLVYSTDLVPEAWHLPTIRAAEVAIRICAIAIMVFMWRVFVPGRGYALGVVLTLTAVMLVSHLIAPHGARFAEGATQLIWSKAAYYARTLAFSWGTFESLRYWGSCRRRLRLGLIDPLVAHRFLLWSVALGASSFLMGSVLIAPLFGFRATEIGWLLVESAFGIIAAVAIWLTFFPPARYRAWIANAPTHRAS